MLLLDEPTSGLDPEIRRSVRRLLDERRAAGCAILVSTHNLDEAERIADRVAVLDRRLLALDRTTALRRRLTTGRLFVRLDGDVDGMLAAAPALRSRRHASRTASSSLRVDRPRRDTPAIVAALAAAGARVLEVRPEMPPLEDVYMHLVGEKPEGLERPVQPVGDVDHDANPGALLKELLDLLRNRRRSLPVMIVTLMSLVLPFMIVVAIPRSAASRSISDADLIRVSSVAGVQASPVGRRADPVLSLSAVPDAVPADADHGRDGARGALDRRREAGADARAAAGDADHDRRAAGREGAGRAAADARDLVDRPGTLFRRHRRCSPIRESRPRC